jgi:hypothetical protein
MTVPDQPTHPPWKALALILATVAAVVVLAAISTVAGR